MLSTYATGLFLYPLETLKNQRFSGVFRGYRKSALARNGLRENNLGHNGHNYQMKIKPDGV